MLFRRCEKCHSHRVQYIVGNRVKVEICKSCLLLYKLRGFDDMKERKIHILDSFTFIGGFITYFLFPPLIIIDWLTRKK
jgi:hypothetical protein